MAPPKKKLWPLDEHTKGKHLVLRSYLDAWLPILGTWNGRILFIDAFAGPGEYEGGEEGSPQIALRAFVEHSAKKTIKAQVGYIFIEKDEHRAKHLAGLVDGWKENLPNNCRTEVVHGQFAQLAEVLDSLDEQKKRLAPTFLMIDPFGVSETPMSVIARVLSNNRCEVYASLMYEPINRFCSRPEFAPHLDELFGTSDWRKCAELNNRTERQNCFFQLYESQLRAAGAQHVVHFDLYEGNRFIYSIFFATQHRLGCDRMKAAIWKVAPDGNYRFRGTHSQGQLSLDIRDPNFGPLKQTLRDVFGGEGWVRVEKVKEFVQSDQCDYRSGQLKRGALVPLEKEGLVEADETTRGRRGTFPDGCRIRFR